LQAFGELRPVVLLQRPDQPQRLAGTLKSVIPAKAGIRTAEQ